MSVIQYTGVEYDGLRYPVWAEAVGWLLSAFLVGQVPFWAVVSTVSSVLRGSGTDQLRDLLQPDTQWGPARQSNRLPVAALETDVEETSELTDNTARIESCHNGHWTQRK